jgi:hypothetical protein
VVDLPLEVLVDELIEINIRSELTQGKTPIRAYYKKVVDRSKELNLQKEKLDVYFSRG